MIVQPHRAATTVFCAVWSGDPDRHSLLRGHQECLERQSANLAAMYVFDAGDEPPAWLRGQSVVADHPLTIYQAWEVACQRITTRYVMNLNLDDRLGPLSVELLQATADANNAGLVGGDWRVAFSQDDTDRGTALEPATTLYFSKAWPPKPGRPQRLGSGTGDRGTYGPATLWRAALHDEMPYPWAFRDGSPIRVVGDLAWWTVVSSHFKVPMIRLPVLIGAYHSHPSDQAEFRFGSEHEKLGSGIGVERYPSVGVEAVETVPK